MAGVIPFLWGRQALCWTLARMEAEIAGHPYHLDEIWFWPKNLPDGEVTDLPTVATTRPLATRQDLSFKKRPDSGCPGKSQSTTRRLLAQVIAVCSPRASASHISIRDFSGRTVRYRRLRLLGGTAQGDRNGR